MWVIRVRRIDESISKTRTFTDYMHNGYMFNLSPGEYDIEVETKATSSWQSGMAWMIRTVGDDVILNPNAMQKKLQEVKKTVNLCNPRKFLIC